MAAYHGNSLPADSEPELQVQLLRLAQERRELTDYAERVTRELRRYQQARPAPTASPDDDLPLPPWATNMQMMSPLLFSYEERIAELEAVIERSVSLAEQAQTLAKENDTLRAELHERTEQLRNAQLMGAPRAGGVDDEQEEVRELYRLSVEQNEALAQQNQLLKLQLDKMQQTQAAGQQQSKEVHARSWEYSKALQAEQEKSEALSRQRTAVERRLEEVTAELVEEVRSRDQLQAQVEGLQHELSLQRQSWDHNKRSFEERCTLAVDEEDRLKNGLAKSTKSEKEHRQRLAIVERELAEATDQLQKVRSEGAGTKQEAEQMLRLMESMERRLRDISERHDGAQAKLQEQDGQVAELLMEKDRWSSSEQASKRHADRIEARLQSEFDNLKSQKEQELESLQSAQRKAVSELEERSRRSEQAATEFQNKAELFEKQRAWEAAALERQSSVHRAERDQLRAETEEAQKARIRLERQGDDSQQQLLQLRSELDAVSLKAKEQLTRGTSEQVSLRSRFQSLEQNLVQAQEELKSTLSRASAAEADTLRSQTELQDLKLRANDQIEAERRRGVAEKRGLERQLHSLQARSQQEEKRAMDLLRSQEALRLQWQTELGLERDALASQVDRLAKENRSIKEKSRGVLKALAVRRAGGDEMG